MSGEEQKLQALFSELKATDKQAAPRFVTVWNRAQPASRHIRAFNPAYVGVAALIVCGLISLAVRSRYVTRAPGRAVVKNETTPNVTGAVNGTPAMTPASQPPLEQPPETPIASRSDKSKTRRNARLAMADRKLTRGAKTISSWQSPTSALLTSPSDKLFSTLPQLTESATQLKSFLPNSPN